MRIGELALRAEVNVQTIRFYERRKLLRAPPRTAGGYRSYEKKDLEHLLFIKWCQRLGFTLQEVRELLPLHSALSGKPVSRNQRELQGILRLAEAKLKNIESKIVSLRQMAGQVKKALHELRKAPVPLCPASRRKRATTPAPVAGHPHCPRN